MTGPAGSSLQVDEAGSSALHLAAQEGHLECCCELARMGANPRLVDAEGHTAAQGLQGSGALVQRVRRVLLHMQQQHPWRRQNMTMVKSRINLTCTLTTSTTMTLTCTSQPLPWHALRLRLTIISHECGLA